MKDDFSRNTKNNMVSTMVSKWFRMDFVQPQETPDDAKWCWVLAIAHVGTSEP